MPARVCATCKYWAELDEPWQVSFVSKTESILVGECRRHAPQLRNQTDEPDNKLWPKTFEVDNCGDWDCDED